MKLKVSVIGTGLMGSALAETLLRAGHSVSVYNRTRSKAERLATLGAEVAENAALALENCDLALCVLFDAASTKEVLLSSEPSRRALAGKLLINVAATSPIEIQELAREIASEGGDLAEVVVVGYPQHVREGNTGYLIASGSRYAETWCALFRTMSPDTQHVGAVGNASKAEMALWLPYMFMTVAAAYALAPFESQSLPVPIIRAIMKDNPVLRLGGADRAIGLMAARRYDEKNWTVENFLASCDMIIDFARSMNLPVAVFEEIKKLYSEASRRGLGAEDVSAVYEVIRSTPPPTASRSATSK